MPRILKRTPLATTEAIVKTGRPSNPKHIELYAKQPRITMASTNPKHIQEVIAAGIAAMTNHPHVVGGKAGRSVYFSYEKDIKPVKVFDGVVRPDSIS